MNHEFYLRRLALVVLTGCLGVVPVKAQQRVTIANSRMAKQQGEVVGSIESLAGHVYLKRNGAKRQVLLWPGPHLGAPLHRGEVLWIARGGHVTFHIMKRPYNLYGPQRFPIPNPGRDDDNTSKVLQAAFDLGGGARDPGNLILTPLDGSMVRPRYFGIRWKATPKLEQRIQFQITHRGEKEPFWQSKLVPAKDQQYSEETLGAELEKFQHQADRVALTLTATLFDVHEPGANLELVGRRQVRFYLMPKEQQAQVENELNEAIKGTSGLLSHLMRAGALRIAGLDDERVLELEQAYRAYPDSTIVKALLTNAELRIGNIAPSSQAGGG